MTTVASVRKLSIAGLQAAGFTVEQIENLKRLKARYGPALEQFETNHEYQCLAFMKWRYEQGQV